jgi:hypothetical protein
MDGFVGYLLHFWLARVRRQIFGFVSIVLAAQVVFCLSQIATAARDELRLEKLLTQGLSVDATIDNVDVRSSNFGTSNLVQLSWKDATGATRHQTVQLFENFVPKIVSNGRVIRSSLPIKYLADYRGVDVLPLDDAHRAQEAGRDLMHFEIGVLAICAVFFAALWVVRGHVRRNHPDVPASFTAWCEFERPPVNTFTRVFLVEHRFLTISLGAALFCILIWSRVFEPLEDLTGWTAYWISVAVTYLTMFSLGISGWCYDRYREWRAEQQQKDSLRSMAS